MTDQNYEEVSRIVAEQKQKKAQDEGALAEMLKQLKEEFGIESIADARTKRDDLKRRDARLGKKEDAAYKRFVAKWGDKL